MNEPLFEKFVLSTLTADESRELKQLLASDAVARQEFTAFLLEWEMLADAARQTESVAVIPKQRLALRWLMPVAAALLATVGTWAALHDWKAVSPEIGAPAITAQMAGVVTKGTAHWAAGKPFPYDMPLETGKAEKLVAALTDGSVLTLAANTRAVVPQSRAARLETGTLELECKHDPKNPFNVYADNCTAQAVGTRFVVSVVEEPVRTVDPIRPAPDHGHFLEASEMRKFVQVSILSGVVLVCNPFGRLTASEGSTVVSRQDAAPMVQSVVSGGATASVSGASHGGQASLSINGQSFNVTLGQGDTEAQFQKIAAAVGGQLTVIKNPDGTPSAYQITAGNDQVVIGAGGTIDPSAFLNNQNGAFAGGGTAGLSALINSHRGLLANGGATLTTHNVANSNQTPGQQTLLQMSVKNGNVTLAANNVPLSTAVSALVKSAADAGVTLTPPATVSDAPVSAQLVDVPLANALKMLLSLGGSGQTKVAPAQGKNDF